MSLDFGNATTRCPGCGQHVALNLDTCPCCGAGADTTSEFLPFRYPEGGAGMVDQQTASFLRLKNPEPSAADLDDNAKRTARRRPTEVACRRPRGGPAEPVAQLDDRKRKGSLAPVRTDRRSTRLNIRRRVHDRPTSRHPDRARGAHLRRRRADPPSPSRARVAPSRRP